VAPLKYIGPYPFLSLRFPSHKNATLDFLLDTGASINSIDAQITKDLNLDLVLKSSEFLLGSGSGVGGSLNAGDIYMLGDAHLVGMPQDFTFMRNLTAAAFQYASPAGSGLLGMTFFQSFPAGVEFDWFGTDGDEPTIIFYLGKDLPQEVQANMTARVPLTPLGVAQVLSLTVNINGTDLPALLDTGSPVTVLNRQAAQMAGIDTVHVSTDDITLPPKHKPAIGDNVLAVGGVDGHPVLLYRSSSPVSIQLESIALGQRPVYVGDLPGLAVLGGLVGDNSPPAVVLGLDSLRRMYRMILRPTANELWFEVLKNETLEA